ncbi:MAG: ArsR family transcriptional regulator [Proteobacteria bacterium]|nr:MAG: ArsR family transcriptional regulator [Pseudomonadota bacterium]
MSLVDLFKILSNPVRLRALNLLAQRYPDALCVCDFMALLDCSQTMISRHFKQFRDLGLVTTEQKDQWVHYRLNKDMPANRWALLQTCLQQAAEETPFNQDIIRLKSLRDRC